MQEPWTGVVGNEAYCHVIITWIASRDYITTNRINVIGLGTPDTSDDIK